jgi:hypothetical protein
MEYVSVLKLCNSATLYCVNIYYHLIFWSKIHTNFCIQNLLHPSAVQVLLLVPY